VCCREKRVCPLCAKVEEGHLETLAGPHAVIATETFAQHAARRAGKHNVDPRHLETGLLAVPVSTEAFGNVSVWHFHPTYPPQRKTYVGGTNLET